MPRAIALLCWIAASLLLLAACSSLAPESEPVSQVRVKLAEVLADAGQGHVPEGTGVDYPDYPPASGKHYPRTLEYGLHAEPKAAGYWLHNLEHGAVVVLYRCSAACATLEEELRQAYETFPKSKQWNRVKLVIVPDGALATPVVALAWTRRLQLDAFDHDALLAFYEANVDRGPEAAP